MTEEQIERRVEKAVDVFDRLLLSGALTQKAYDRNMRDLHAWAEAKYIEANRLSLFRRRE